MDPKKKKIVEAIQVLHNAGMIEWKQFGDDAAGELKLHIRAVDSGGNLEMIVLSYIAESMHFDLMNSHEPGLDLASLYNAVVNKSKVA
jgi:hypothetical protein